jgi:uncharacterized protein YyaL (SSP411 family)
MANRLANATSPYLQQHAGNPVDWWEWGPEAFEEARRRDAPILLSVGYAACHWCHVMAHESFEDEATAAYLNEHYVPIKVDREERPDVDAVYMQATVAMTGQGGWPMTCVLDHDGTPFFAGTYFPDAPRHGQPSFMQLLTAINEAWRERRGEIASSAENIREHLRKEAQPPGGVVDETSIAAALAVLEKEYDEANGGFGTAPKFPPSMVLDFLRLHERRTGSESSARMLEGTLEAMAWGGMYDQLGGGFARYSVDPSWVVPHFEKMLYDNALLLKVYADWVAAGSELAEGIRRVAGRGHRGPRGRVLRLDTRPADRGARRGRRCLGGQAAQCDRDGHLRGRCIDAAAARGSRRARALGPRTRTARTGARSAPPPGP